MDVLPNVQDRSDNYNINEPPATFEFPSSTEWFTEYDPVCGLHPQVEEPEAFDEVSMKELWPPIARLFGFTRWLPGTHGMARQESVKGKWPRYAYTHPLLRCDHCATEGLQCVIHKVNAMKGSGKSKKIGLKKCWGCVQPNIGSCSNVGLTGKASKFLQYDMGRHAYRLCEDGKEEEEAFETGASPSRKRKRSLSTCGDSNRLRWHAVEDFIAGNFIMRFPRPQPLHLGSVDEESVEQMGNPTDRASPRLESPLAVAEVPVESSVPDESASSLPGMGTNLAHSGPGTDTGALAVSALDTPVLNTLPTQEQGDDEAAWRELEEREAAVRQESARCAEKRRELAQRDVNKRLHSLHPLTSVALTKDEPVVLLQKRFALLSEVDSGEGDWEIEVFAPKSGPSPFALGKIAWFRHAGVYIDRDATMQHRLSLPSTDDQRQRFIGRLVGAFHLLPNNDSTRAAFPESLFGTTVESQGPIDRTATSIWRHDPIEDPSERPCGSSSTLSNSRLQQLQRSATFRGMWDRERVRTLSPEAIQASGRVLTPSQWWQIEMEHRDKEASQEDSRADLQEFKDGVQEF